MLSADSPGSPDPDSTDDSSSGPTTSATSSALEAYGAAAITLELISSTALFLAREPFRVALARSRVPSATTAAIAAAAVASDGDAGRGDRERAGRLRREAYRRRFVNTAWVAAPAGVAFAAIVRLVYPWVIQNDAFGGIEENRQVLVPTETRLPRMFQSFYLVDFFGYEHECKHIGELWRGDSRAGRTKLHNRSHVGSLVCQQTSPARLR